MNEKHTPRQWQIVEITDEKMISTWLIKIGDYKIPFFPYVYQFADKEKTCGGYVNDPEMHANARLIAAAPELLEALKRMEFAFLPFASDCTLANLIDEARAAIAKAEGVA